MTKPVPPLLREQLKLGELDEDTAAQVQSRLADESADPYAHLPSDAQTFADDPPEDFARAVRARAAEAEWTEARPSVVWWRPLIAVAAVLLAVVVLQPTEPDVLTKGQPILSVYRQASTGPVKLADGDDLAPGDQVQVAIAVPGMTHALIYSVDGAGVVTEHERFVSDEPLKGRLVLDHAYILDDAPAYEVFHLVAAPRRFDMDALLDKQRRRGATKVPPAPPVPGAQVRTLVLDKP